MDYTKRLRRQIEKRKPEILVTGSTLLEIELLSELRPAHYSTTPTAKSRATGDYYQWWHLQEEPDSTACEKFSARREGLVPIKR